MEGNYPYTLICNKKSGGCGFVGIQIDFFSKDKHLKCLICPKCGMDHINNLQRDNFERIVPPEDMEGAKKIMLDGFAKLTGGLLKNYFNWGYIWENDLTDKQRKELSLKNC
jgi:hypothetical protein